MSPQALVFECFECGIPCSIDPKMGVSALPRNMVLIKAVEAASEKQSTGGETGAGESTSAGTGVTKST